MILVIILEYIITRESESGSMMAPSGSSRGSNSIGNGSSGWTSFDLGVLGEEEGEEVALPNPNAHAVPAIPPEPNLELNSQPHSPTDSIHPNDADSNQLKEKKKRNF